MAGSSLSSGGLCKHDVFLSFRGKDTRRIFVCHLYRALKQKAIDAFIDSEDLSKGNKISELLKAIEDSRISIVVLSENYASSSWCLKELVKILECMDTKNQIVKPIFYDVAPSDIRNLDGKFGEAFAKEFGGADQQELESWRSALAAVAGLSGWVSTTYEDDGKLIEEIVEDTLKNWIRISPGKATGLVGMDSHVKEMKLRLCLEKDDVRFVGIWGMGGIGKTTIARAVYDEIACQFEHVCFLDHVNYHFANKREVKLQEKLLSGLLKDEGKIECLSRGRNLIMQKLGKKKVLVVLDDVRNSTQIEDVLGNNQDSFGVGSRIIITTRYKQSLSGVPELYEPKELSDYEADELFMKHAFRKNQPTEDYNLLLRRAREYAKGLPLALKVLGASLCDKKEDEWKHVLNKLKKTPKIEILDVLKTSMEGLDDFEKDIFLDIACFFRGMKQDFVKEFLDDCGFIPDAGLMVLLDKALITISDDECIDMHDLLQEMGRDIVRQECCKEPGRRSRLWDFEDVNHVLTKNTGTEAVECINLNLRESEIDQKIDTRAFIGMTNLRLLMIYKFLPYAPEVENEDEYENYGCIQHVTNLEFLSNELRFLCWQQCPLKSLPSNFNPENLLKLDMRGSHIQQLWEGIKSLKKLKVIDLGFCHDLVKTPDLTGVTNLESLLLDLCSSLIKVHPSISALQKLRILSLAGCKKLKNLPSIIHMKSLRRLILNHCSNLKKCPEFSEEMDKLEYLSLAETAIKEVPSSINNLTGLRNLYFRDCKELERLPSTIHMKSLQKLYLHGCSNLKKCPEFSEELDKLEYLSLDETAIKEVPSSINNLTGLRNLYFRDCKQLERLPSTIHMKSLQKLSLHGCSNLKKCPEISEELDKLEYLSLDETAIKEVPSSINYLTGLRNLYVEDCKELERLPSAIHMKSLQGLSLHGCSNLKKYPEFSEEMDKLEYLSLDETAIKEVPSSINNLTGLRNLYFRDCKQLERLPSTIHMKSLQKLSLHGCSNLKKCPEFSEEMDKLEYLSLDDTAITEVPSSINNLTGLCNLYFRDCKELERLPSTIHMKSLQELSLHGCSNLKKCPEFSEEMDKQEYLSLDETAFKEVPSSINNLTGLRNLYFRDCKELERLPSTIHMKSLQELSLHGCSNLKKCPEFSEEMDKLEYLSLDDTAIKEVPSSINNLTGLRNLYFRDCKELERLPSTIHMKSLQQLSLHGCSNLKKCPEFSEVMDKLEDLSLDETAIKEVPSSINNLTGLRNLYFRDCKQLERLPSTIHMKSLQELSLHGCSNLKTCPEFSEEMDKLEDLTLDETAIKELPSSINNLTGLRDLYFRDCKELERLPSTIHMKSLQELSLHGCSNLKKCPEFSEEMDKLEYLSLDETAIKEVPSSINNLTGLRNLYFRDCKELERLPSTIHMKSLQELSLHGCSNLKTCPEFSKEMDKLEDLSLDKTAIKEVSSSINNLTGLRNLYFGDCKELERLPSTIHMNSLQELSLHGCSNLKKCPEFSEEMDKLEDLSLDETAIKELPSSINNLTGLRNLYSEDCKELERLPSTIHMKSLLELSLHGCSNLKKCPEFSEEMDKLEYLSLDETAIKEVPSSINNLTGLRNLYFRDCKELERLPSTIHMKSLQKLSLHGCSNLKKCPEFSEEMDKLEYLSLDETAYKEVPSSINNLTGLRNLYFRDCKEQERLPSTIHMKSLQELSLHGCSNLKKCPEFSEEMDKLEYLSLDETAIKEVPSSINNLTGLRNLYFRDCKELERLPSTIHMKSLQQLSLHGCSNLKKCPEFSEVMDKLEYLSLDETAIKEVPSSINNLTGLRNLYFRDCKELERLPSTIHMKSLQELSFPGCSNLKKCPEFSEEMDKLEYLSLDETAIKEVPSSINNLTGLRNLYFRDCKEVERLPSTIHMKSLQQLSLHGCSNLKKCPEFSEVMDKLEYLSLDETAIKEVPSSINNLTGLRNLYFRDCKELERLPSTIHMKSLQKLSLHGCSNLKKCPEFSEELDKLEYLSLDETAIKEVPSSINNLTGLRNLYFRDCKQLERLPSTIHMKSPQKLSLHGCLNLKKCPEFSEEMDKLEYLSLDETAIKEVPSSINNLTGLRNLYFRDCKELERLPSTIHMKSLQELSLHGCSNLKKCPEFSEEMDKLEYLSLDETAIKEVPSSINNLTGLRNLYFRDCKEVERLPSTIHMKSLQELSLHGCSNLKKCPEFSEEMDKLEYLSLDETAIKEVPSSINNLTGLRNLYFRDCKEVERLPSTIHMKSLQQLSLHGCSNLKKCPEFSEVMDKLEYLSLDETAIKEVPSSINNLTGLRNLYFRDCKELERLPSTIHMKSLQELSLYGCSNLKKCPEFSEEIDKLEYLSLDETAIKEVPSSINNLTGLRNLYFGDCKELERLPSTIHMNSLQELSLHGCSNLKKCPEFSEEMGKLEDLSLDETAIKELPSSINNLTGLRNLYSEDCKELERLPSTIHMKSLQMLSLHGCSNLKKCPEFSEEMDKLEYLSLDETTIKEVPSSINNLTGLRNLYFRDCKELERLPSTIHMKSLQELSLHGCSNLKKCPEFSEEMDKLEYLSLDETAIKEVPSSINNLTGLRNLYFRDCKEVERLPSTIHMKSLQQLSLHGCSNLKKCAEFSEVMDKLEYLSLDETAIKAVPSSINNLTGLRNLYFRDCKELERLPSTIHMKSLQKLSLHGCSNLKKCPEFSEEMDKLEYLSLDETAIKEVPSSINNLTGLRNLYFRDCEEVERLPSTIRMKSLQQLSLHGCSNLKKCPEFSEVMDKLEYLSLDETAIKEVPSSINNLTGLRNLYFRDCKELERLPSTIHMKSLQKLSLHGCSNLKKCPEFSEELDKLEYLSLDETAIKEVPSSINNLTGLRNLYFRDCKQLERLPSTIHMKSLQELSLYGCSNFKKCPEFSEEMDKLEDLSLDETAIKEVPSSINNITGLRNLYFQDCKELERLPSTMHMKSLWLLNLHGCSNLKKCPEFSEEMDKLENLLLGECAIKEVPSSINNLKGLRNLDLRGCKELEMLPSTIRIKSLQILILFGCSSLKKCPEFSKDMEKLEELWLGECAIKEVPSSVNNLTGLRDLDLRGCRELERLPSCKAKIFCDQDKMPNLSNSCRTEVSFLNPCEMRNKETEEGRNIFTHCNCFLNKR